MTIARTEGKEEGRASSRQRTTTVTFPVHVRDAFHFSILPESSPVRS
jgi:hypothetical protein